MDALPVSFSRHAEGQRALADVVGAIGRAGFARTALDAINRQVAATSWAVYRVWKHRPPVLYLSASRQAEDTTTRCFDTYRDHGLYRRDASFDTVRRHGPRDGATVLRMHAEEAPNADHRDAIYRRYGMVERLSAANVEDDGSLITMNLYHHAHQGRFDAAEVERFVEMLPVLAACVSRHIDWLASAPKIALRERLSLRCASLTGRELDVLERLLQGMSYDGIAADMGLAVASVKTYRSRAFRRLDMHYKSELFSAFQS